MKKTYIQRRLSYQSPYKGFNSEGGENIAGAHIEYQSPYKGFNRMLFGVEEVRVEGVKYQSPYKGFNRTR